MTETEPRALGDPLPSRRRLASAAAPALVVVLLTVVLYGRHIADGFLADDFAYASWARQGIGLLMRRFLRGSSHWQQSIRPLPGLTWMLSRVAGGAQLMHGLSLLLHAANGLLVADIVRRGCAEGAVGPVAGEPVAAEPATGESVPSRPAAAGPAGTPGPAPGDAWTAAAFAALFVAFPLFAEPVIWLSASTDLWACCFALAAVWMAGRADGRRLPAAVAAGGLYLAALLCKESVLCLPLILPALYPWWRVRRTAAVMAGMAGIYLTCRLLLFSGLGGYLRGDDRSVLRSLTPRALWTMARSLTLQVLVPFKQAAENGLEWPLAVVSAALIGGFLVAATIAAGSRLRRRRSEEDGPGPAAPPSPDLSLGLSAEPEPVPSLEPSPGPSVERSRVPAAGRSGRLLPAAAALLLALLPVAPVLWIDADQEGSRLLYFPVAVLAIALGLRVRPLLPLGRALALALAAYWGVATVWNGRAWSHASWETGHTLAAMESLAPGLPPGAEVFVAGHDVWQGALTWRNGVANAARWRGLRPDVSWSLGTVAAAGAPAAAVGSRVFEIGIDDAGRPMDWTPCERALLMAPPAALTSWAVSSPAPQRPDLVSPAISLRQPAAVLAVTLELAAGRPPEAILGRLFWRLSGSEHFHPSDSAWFSVAPDTGPRIGFRVAAEPPRQLSSIKLWLHAPPAALRHLLAVHVAAAPAACASPRR